MKLPSRLSFPARTQVTQKFWPLLSASRRRSYSTSTTSKFTDPQNDSVVKSPPLSIMPTTLLLRSYFITKILASPRILRFCLPVMIKIANSSSPLLNPDRNPVLHVIVKKLLYDHFSAGETISEVKTNVAAMKKLGFRGVILGYAKEVSVTSDSTPISMPETPTIRQTATQVWRDGTLKSLSCIGQDDCIALKFSGAGFSVLKALRTASGPPSEFWDATLDICDAAIKQNTRIWIDAEQQDLQGAVEQWTVDLMRKYNKGEKAAVFTTMQAYLKHTPANILKHLKIAQDECWILGIKLVRGAYIATEQRHLIHDTIEDTHNTYNTIASGILSHSYPGLPPTKSYPRVELFLATHNDTSIKKAYETQRSLLAAGKPTIPLRYAQLQGMADEISCSLLQLCRAVQPGETDSEKLALAPESFKCLAWGTTQECLQFLLRRVKENEDALGRTKFWVVGFRREVWRRLKGSLHLR